jgi:tetratricopeptide (TPR) repeat protein
MRRSFCLSLALTAMLGALLCSYSRAAAAEEVQPGSEATAAGDARAAAADAARPANVAEAEQYAEQAFEAYRDKDYERALALYERALAAAKSADILYNIARVYDVGLHDGTRASEYYRRYLAEPKAQPPRSQLAERRVSELDAAQPAALPERVPSATPAPALEPGVAAAPSAPAPLASSGWTWRQTTAAVLAGTGVVALGVGTGFGIAAYSHSDDWKQDCDGDRCASQSGVDAAHSAARLANVATVALAAGGALLAGGAALWWLGPKQDEARPQLALALAPARGGAEIGCTLAGSF